MLQAPHSIRRQAPLAAERVLAIARSQYVLDVRDNLGAERLELRVRTGRQEAPAPLVHPFQVGNRLLVVPERAHGFVCIEADGLEGSLHRQQHVAGVLTYPILAARSPGVNRSLFPLQRSAAMIRPSASSPSGALKAAAMLRTSDLSPLAAFFLASSMFTSPSALSILNHMPFAASS